MLKNIVLILIISMTSLFSSEYYYEYGKKVHLTKLYEPRAVSNEHTTYYLTPNGQKVGVQDKIIVKCKEGINCETELKKQNFLTITKLSKKLFLVQISKDKNIFEVAQELYKNPSVILAEPDFIKKLKKR